MVVGCYECSRVFVQADSNGEGIVRKSDEETAHTITLLEVVINDNLVCQAESGRDSYHLGSGAGTLISVGDHML